MGKRGPAPTPTAMLELRGSWRARRNPREPRPDPAAPPCPDWLDEQAREMWTRTAPLLSAAGILTMADANVLARYCRLWSRWRRAEDFIEQYGNTYPIKDDSGAVRYLAQFPEVGIAGKLAQQLTRLEQELGLTPSARSRVSVAPPRPQAPADSEQARRMRNFERLSAQIERRRWPGGGEVGAG